MACRKPIIGCLDGEGARIIKESASGLVALGEDENSLCEQILFFFSLPASDRALMGENALAYYKKEFDRETLVDQLISVLHG